MKKILTKKVKSSEEKAKMLRKLAEYDNISKDVSADSIPLVITGLRMDIENIAHPQCEMISELCGLISKGLTTAEIKHIINLL